MPTAIKNYAINVDTYHLKVKSTGSPANQPNFITLLHSEAKASYQCGPFLLEKVASTDRGYRLRYNISVGGIPFAYLHTNLTERTAYNRHMMPLSLQNEAFYQLPFALLLSEFLRLLALAVASNTQLDICIDTQEADPTKLMDYYLQRPGEYQRLCRKSEVDALDIRGKKNAQTGKIIGYTTYLSENSERVSLKIYDKTKELTGKPKAWVTLWHLEHGFDPQKPVYRIEISIKAKALRDYEASAVTPDGEVISRYRANADLTVKTIKQTKVTAYSIEVERLSSPAYLAAVFNHFNPLDIRKTDRTRATNCTPVALIDFTVFGEDTVNKTVKIKDSKTQQIAVKRRLRADIIDYIVTANGIHLEAAYATAKLHQATDILEKLLAEYQPQIDRMLPEMVAV